MFISYLSITTVRKGLLKRVEFNLTYLEKLSNAKKIVLKIILSFLYILNTNIKYCSFQYLEISYITLLTTKIQN